MNNAINANHRKGKIRATLCPRLDCGTGINFFWVDLQVITRGSSST